jgi:hypothetical protein
LAAAFAVVAAIWYFRADVRGLEAARAANAQHVSAKSAAAAAPTARPAPAFSQITGTRAAWASLPRGIERNQRIERDAYEIASHDLEIAWEKLALLEDPAERAIFLRGMFVAIAARAPRDAIASLKKVARGDERNLAMETMANAWRGGVPFSSPSFRAGDAGRMTNAARLGLSLLDGTVGRAELALIWTQELVTEPADRAALFGAAAAAFTLKEPERVAAMSASLPDDASREIFRDEFAWSLRMLAGDAAWASTQSLPAGDLRNVAQSTILREWAAADPTAAAAAIASLPDADDRTRAIAVLAEAWGARDTVAAFAWATTMDAENRAAAEEAIRRSAPVGIGAVIATSEDGYPVIRELLPGGAAERTASIPPGSKIIALVDANGQTVNTHGLELSKVISQLRGPKGAPVTILVQPPDTGEQRKVTIVREQIIHKTAKK